MTNTKNKGGRPKREPSLVLRHVRLAIPDDEYIMAKAEGGDYNPVAREAFKLGVEAMKRRDKLTEKALRVAG